MLAMGLLFEISLIKCRLPILELMHLRKTFGAIVIVEDIGVQIIP